MKILVCMKQVPQKDAPLKLNEAGTWIREDVSYEVNEPDAFALEEALRQKEKHSGEVVVVTAGPARAQQVLREALAKGANRAIHLEGDGFVGLDAYNTARAIAAAIKDEQFDLIFTGLQSDDYGYAQTGVILAEILGWPHATIIMQIEKNDTGIRVKRELEAGFFQFVDRFVDAVVLFVEQRRVKPRGRIMAVNLLGEIQFMDGMARVAGVAERLAQIAS